MVDDSEDIRLLWRAWLSLWGFTVDEASDGTEALRKAHAHTPDLVLMDIWMPGMDGISATARLREDPATSNVPVLAVSADPTASSSARATRARFDGSLTKPVDLDELLANLRSVLANARETNRSESSEN